MKYFYLSFFIFCGYLSASAQKNEYLETVIEYVSKLQYDNPSLPSYGALRKGYAPEYGQNNDQYKIEPYFSNIGILGILHAKASLPENEKIIPVVEKWMDWYITKMNPTLVNYYYDISGDNETTCPPGGGLCNDIDAQDSDPTLFFLVLNKYYDITKDRSWFINNTEHKLKLEEAADFVVNLIDPNYGLTIAKTTYPIAYTMDNSEVYAGLIALSTIEKDVYNDIEKSQYYANIANSIKENIETYLYPSNPTKTSDYKYYASKESNNNNAVSINSLYSFLPALWPLLFGVDTPESTTAIYSESILNDNFEWTSPSWLTDNNSGGFWWTSLGYLSLLYGNESNTIEQIDNIRNAETFVTGSSKQGSYIGDAGFLLMSLSFLHSNQSTGTEDLSPRDTTPFAYSVNKAELKINNLSFDSEITIINMSGQVIVSQLKATDNYSTNIPSGFYIVQINQNSKVYTIKTFVK